jgi:Uncharacterized protein conserved in cyanobacteria
MKDEQHLEVINGIKTIKKAISPLHNEIINALGFSLKSNIIENKKKCRLFTDTVRLFCNDVKDFYKENTFLPDLMVICNYKEGDIKEDGVHTTPQFVCEVASKNTFINDYNIKERYISGYYNIN